MGGDNGDIGGDNGDKGGAHHVDLQQQQLQRVAPAQAAQALVDVVGVEVVVAQAGGGTK